MDSGLCGNDVGIASFCWRGFIIDNEEGSGWKETGMTFFTTTQILDGKLVAEQVLNTVEQELKTLQQKGAGLPKLVAGAGGRRSGQPGLREEKSQDRPENRHAIRAADLSCGPTSARKRWRLKFGG